MSFRLSTFLLSLGLSLGLSFSPLTTAFSSENTPPTSPCIGVVNFSTCITESKEGKQEQASFESLKNQMGSLVEETEKQLNEISGKFNDKEYLEGLSPEGEEELKEKFRTLNDDLNRYQNQYYQVLNQANMRIMQSLSTSITAAAEKIAQEKNLSLILNKEACFYYLPSLDVTSLVIAKMDESYQPSKKPAPEPAKK